MRKIIDLFFDYPVIVIYSSSKNVSGTYHVPGPVLRETTMNKINKSQLLRSLDFSRETKNPHKGRMK